MVEQQHRPRILLETIETDDAMAASLQVSHAVVALCDSMANCSVHLDETVPTANWDRTPAEVSASDGHLQAVNPTLDPASLAKRCLD